MKRPSFVALVPVKPPAVGKSRMRGVTDDERAWLATGFALDVVAACLDTPAVVRVLAVGAAGVLAVVALFAAGGYWWFEGFAAAGDRVRSGPSYADRPLAYFLVANLAAAALALGPAAVAGLASLRRHRLALLPLAALVGIVVSDLTGLVRGETERIWLPFYVWVLTATAFLPVRRRRLWLALGVLLAIGIEVQVRTEW